MKPKLTKPDIYSNCCLECGFPSLTAHYDGCSKTTKPKTDKQGWEEEFDNKVKEMPKKLIELVEWNKIKDFIRQLYQQALAEGKRIGREVAGLPEEVLFICPKCGTPQEGEITSKPQQQESWKLSILDRVVQLGNYLDTKHGKGVVIPDEWAAGLYKDIESLISAERQRVIEEVMELVDRYKEEYKRGREDEAIECQKDMERVVEEMKRDIKKPFNKKEFVKLANEVGNILAEEKRTMTGAYDVTTRAGKKRFRDVLRELVE